MDGLRAYSRVEDGLARLGNRWVERCWSTFLGHTVELCQKDGALEWTSRQSPEFCFEVDRTPVGHLSFDRALWSEECNPFGAALQCTRMSDELIVEIHVQAFHDSPGLLRRVSLANLTPKAKHVTRACTEVLALKAPGTEVRTHGFRRRGQALSWETEERAAALVRGDRGMLFGIASGGLYELFAPDASVCAVGPGEKTVLAPGATRSYPDTFLLPYRGDLDAAMGRDFGDFLKHVSDLKQWEAVT